MQKAISYPLSCAQKTNQTATATATKSTYCYPQLTAVQHLITEPSPPYKDFQQLKLTTVRTEPAGEKQGPQPCIKLQGRWLTAAGFDLGKPCLIEVYKGVLIITLDE